MTCGGKDGWEIRIGVFKETPELQTDRQTNRERQSSAQRNPDSGLIIVTLKSGADTDRHIDKGTNGNKQTKTDKKAQPIVQTQKNKRDV